MIIPLLFSCGYVAVLRLQNRLIIENRTGQTIQQVHVRVCEKDYFFYDIPANSYDWSIYSNGVESTFYVQAILQGGTTFWSGGGYVSTEIGSRAKITIKANRKVKVDIE